MAKVTNVLGKTFESLQENLGKRVGWEICGGLAAVVAEAVRRTCAWLYMAARVGEEMSGGYGVPSGA
jgi:hypothetical protein